MSNQTIVKVSAKRTGKEIYEGEIAPENERIKIFYKLQGPVNEYHEVSLIRKDETEMSLPKDQINYATFLARQAVKGLLSQEQKMCVSPKQFAGIFDKEHTSIIYTEKIPVQLVHQKQLEGILQAAS